MQEVRPIDANALHKAVKKWLPQDPCGREEKEFPFETDICVSMLMEIEEAPTIEAEPVRHGRWEIALDGITPFCSECCHTHRLMIRIPNYCPNCGAKMDKEENDTHEES